MKILPYLLLLIAGAVLARIAWQAPDPDYVAPKLADDEPRPHVPVALVGDVPDGYLVRKLDVAGMCCSGCSLKIHTALTSVSGVVEAAVNFDRKSAAAVVPASMPPEDLTTAATFDKYNTTLTP